MTMNDQVAVDTNVLLYSIDLEAPEKMQISLVLVEKEPVICSQNLSEFINVLLRRWKYPKDKVSLVVAEVLKTCIFYPNTKETYLQGFDLVAKYDFQIFDAIIVASALEAGCNILYTEDMQHGLVVENQLQIVNPFL